jgi:DNA-binding response OmpR family regulator
MSTGTIVLIAREDLSIPGAAEAGAEYGSGPDRSDAVRARFFDLVNRSKPDIIVLDLSRSPGAATDAVLAVSERTRIPILVVCNPDQPRLDEYRVAGAADCVSAPVDIIALRHAIERVIRDRDDGGAPLIRRADFVFAGMRFRPQPNLVAGEHGPSVALTSAEGRLLAHLLSKPRSLCTRAEIGELLYGPEHSAADRAIDVVVSRLRKKLAVAGGEGAEELIKPEPRRGYSFLADVAAVPAEAAVPASGA